MDISTFHYRLREARERKGLTQEQLSKSANLSVQTICGYEKTQNGKAPTLKNIVTLSNALGVSIDWLCGLSDSMTAAKDNDDYLTSVGDFASLFVGMVTSGFADFELRDSSEYGFPGKRLSINVDDADLVTFVTHFEKLSALKKDGVIDHDLFSTLISDRVAALKNIPMKKCTTSLYDDDTELPF